MSQTQFSAGQVAWGDAVPEAAVAQRSGGDRPLRAAAVSILKVAPRLPWPCQIVDADYVSHHYSVEWLGKPEYKKYTFPTVITGDSLSELDCDRVAKIWEGKKFKRKECQLMEEALEEAHRRRALRLADEKEAYARSVRELLEESANDNGGAVSRELKAGYTIFYWQPGTVVGVAENGMLATILEVYTEDRIAKTSVPLRLDSGHILMLDSAIKVLTPYETREMIELQAFLLVTGSVDAPAASVQLKDHLRGQIAKLRGEHPEFAGIISKQYDDNGDQEKSKLAGSVSKRDVSRSSRTKLETVARIKSSNNDNRQSKCGYPSSEVQEESQRIGIPEVRRSPRVKPKESKQKPPKRNKEIILSLGGYTSNEMLDSDDEDDIPLSSLVDQKIKSVSLVKKSVEKRTKSRSEEVKLPRNNIEDYFKRSNNSHETKSKKHKSPLLVLNSPSKKKRLPRIIKATPSPVISSPTKNVYEARNTSTPSVPQGSVKQKVPRQDILKENGEQRIRLNEDDSDSDDLGVEQLELDFLRASNGRSMTSEDLSRAVQEEAMHEVEQIRNGKYKII